jgi:hypothetical protein
MSLFSSHFMTILAFAGASNERAFVETHETIIAMMDSPSSLFDSQHYDLFKAYHSVLSTFEAVQNARDNFIRFVKEAEAFIECLRTSGKRLRRSNRDIILWALEQDVSELGHALETLQRAYRIRKAQVERAHHLHNEALAVFNHMLEFPDTFELQVLRFICPKLDSSDPINLKEDFTLYMQPTGWKIPTRLRKDNTRPIPLADDISTLPLTVPTMVGPKTMYLHLSHLDETESLPIGFTDRFLPYDEGRFPWDKDYQKHSSGRGLYVIPQGRHKDRDARRVCSR